MSPYAGVGRRAAATMIDLVILAVILAILVAIFGERQEQSGVFVDRTGQRFETRGTNYGFSGFATLIPLAAVAAYFVGFEAAKGATPGKMAVGIHVMRNDGDPIGLREAAIRTLLRPIDAFFFYLVGAVAVWTSQRHQRLGDRLAGTIVVHPTHVISAEVIPRPVRPGPVDRTAKVVCSRCKSEVPAAARRCPNCLAELPSVVAT